MLSGTATVFPFSSRAALSAPQSAISAKYGAVAKLHFEAFQARDMHTRRCAFELLHPHTGNGVLLTATDIVLHGPLKFKQLVAVQQPALSPPSGEFYTKKETRFCVSCNRPDFHRSLGHHRALILYY